VARKRFDASLKHLLETYPQDWLAYLLSHLDLTSAGPAKLIDSDVSTVSAAVDKVLRVGGRKPWLLHLELQASHFHRLARQLLLYNVLLTDRHDLPVESVVLLLRPEADRGSLTGVLRQKSRAGRQYLEFHYTVMRLWEQPVEGLLTGGLGLLPLAPLANVPAVQVEGIIHRMEQRIGAESAPAEAADLWTATLVLLGLSYSAEFAAHVLRGVSAMKESVTYQAILAEGKIELARDLLIDMASDRFGPPDPATRATVGAIASLDDLRGLIKRVSAAAGWGDLLATSSSRQAKGRRRKNG
jgi:predicted transposase YdaD